MSLSRPREGAVNPARRFFEWKGGTGHLVYYDKEKETNVTVDLPFRFIVLDQLNTIKGYNEKLKLGYFANEVRGLHDKITLRTKEGVVAEGTWNEISQRDHFAKFTKSIYIAFKDGDGEMVLGNIQAHGSCAGAWFTFTKGKYPKDIEGHAFSMSRGKLTKTGTNEYYPPSFKEVPTTEESTELARAIDEHLQDYLDKYFARGHQPEAEEDVAPEMPFNDEFPIEENAMAVGGAADPQAPPFEEEEIPW